MQLVSFTVSTDDLVVQRKMNRMLLHICTKFPQFNIVALPLPLEMKRVPKLSLFHSHWVCPHSTRMPVSPPHPHLYPPTSDGGHMCLIAMYSLPIPPNQHNKIKLLPHKKPVGPNVKTYMYNRF